MNSEPNAIVRAIAWGSLLTACLFCGARLYQDAGLTTVKEPRKVEQLTQKHWNLAMAALDQNNPLPAVEYTRDSIGKTGLKPQRELLQGRLLLNAGKLLGAGQAFREAGESADWSSKANFWLGATAYKGGNMAVAENYWLAALASDPNNLDAHRSLSMYYYDVGAIDGAVEHLQQATRLNPDDARPFRMLGLIYSDYERYEEAVGFYRSALDRNLTAEVRDQVLRELTSCHLKIREYKPALEVIEKASETLDAMVLKADCLVGLGEQDRAVELLGQALEKDSKHFGTLMSMGAAKMVAGSAEEAVDFLRRAVEVSPKDYAANYRLAQALRGAGKTAEADAIAAKTEVIKAAREKFTQLHKDATSSPRDANIRYQLGITAEELGMPEMAAVWFKAAIQLDPNHDSALQKLGLKPDA